jgi:two-component sensor histidine kinase
MKINYAKYLEQIRRDTYNDDELLRICDIQANFQPTQHEDYEEALIRALTHRTNAALQQRQKHFAAQRNQNGPYQEKLAAGQQYREAVIEVYAFLELLEQTQPKNPVDFDQLAQQIAAALAEAQSEMVNE